MKKPGTVALCSLLWVLTVSVYAGPVKLAVIASDKAQGPFVDLLTVELSSKESVQLLERSEIDKVYREQGLSAANGDFIKVGQVLGADGLLLIGQGKEGTNQILVTRLVAVKPGVVLGVVRAVWPLADPASWAKWMVKRFTPLFPKLGVLVKDAIPISVLNLRAAVPSAEEQELERQLTVLAVERLTREKQFFVLERRGIQRLAAEKELQGMGESAFWSGSFLLDGVVDRLGYSKATVTIHARLVPPQGSGAPTLIEISGSRTNLPETINLLANKVAEALKLGPLAAAWNPAAEADQYFEEAKWAFRWGMLGEAQSASEASWALGKKVKEVAELRIRAYEAEVAPNWRSWIPAALPPTAASEDSKLATAVTALQFYEQGFQNFLATEGKPDMTWYGLLIDVLNSDSELLQQFYYSKKETTPEQGAELAELRSAMRRAFDMVQKHPAYHPLDKGKAEVFIHTQNERDSSTFLGNFDLTTLEAAHGALWCETPEQCQEMYREFVRLGTLHRVFKYLPYHELVAWHPDDRKRVAGLWHEFVQELCTSTNALTKIEGYYLAFADAKPDQPYKEAAIRFFQVTSENAFVVVTAHREEQLLKDIANLLAGPPCGYFDSPVRDQVSGYYYGDFKSDFAQNAIIGYLETDHEFRPSVFSEYAQPLWLANHFRDFPERPRRVLAAMEAYKARITQESKQESLAYDYRNYDVFARWLQQGLPPATNTGPLSSNRVTALAGTYAARSGGTIQRTNQKPEIRAALTNMLHVIRFWNMPSLWVSDDFGSFPDITITGSRFREGRFWMQVLNGNNGTTLHRAFVFGIDLTNMQTEVVDLPLDKSRVGHAEIASTGDSFEVIGQFVYFNRRRGVQRYSLRTRAWEDLGVPLAGRSVLTALEGRLFICTADSILGLSEDGKQVEVLASCRRRPAVTSLDSLDSFDDHFRNSTPLIFQGPGGALRTLINKKVYTRAKSDSDWKETVALPETRQSFSCTPFEEGLIVTHVATDLETRWFLLEHDQTALELLLAEPGSLRWPAGRIGRPPPSGSSSVSLSRWKHPAGIPLHSSPMALEGDRLWFLAGDLSMEADGSGWPLLKQQDGRHAVLLEFKKNATEARVIPLWIDLKEGTIPRRMLQKFGGFSTPTPKGEVRTYVPGAAILQQTPSGLVVSAGNIPGFWLIPRADLELVPGSLDPDRALLAAAESGDSKAAKEALAHGAKVDARDYQGWTPLMIAAKAGCLELARILLEKGADANARSTSKTGSTVLCFATGSDDPGLLALLVNHGADVNALSRNSVAPLYSAASQHKPAAVTWLVTHGAHLEERGFLNEAGQRYTPLMAAAINGDQEIAGLLLDHGANLEATNGLGNTSLMILAGMQKPDMLKFVIDKGARVNAKGPNGHTGLIYAVYRGHIDNIRLLLAAGADPAATETEGNWAGAPTFTAVTLAEQQGQTEVANLLKTAQAGRLPPHGTDQPPFPAK